MQEQTYKLIVDFSVKGDVAYLSHQETLTMFQRALIRASVPLVFSSGFNPHPCLSIPFPRSVGTQSTRDRICVLVHFPEELPPVEELMTAIQNQLPADCRILEVQYSDRKSSFYPESVRYVFCLEPLAANRLQEHLGHCKKQIAEEQSIEVQRYRAKKKRYEPFDIAPYLKEMVYSDDRIETVCGISPSGTVRVDEIMQWLNVRPEHFAEPVCRTEIKWRQN